MRLLSGVRGPPRPPFTSPPATSVHFVKVAQYKLHSRRSHATPTTERLWFWLTVYPARVLRKMVTMRARARIGGRGRQRCPHGAHMTVRGSDTVMPAKKHLPLAPVSLEALGLVCEQHVRRLTPPLGLVVLHRLNSVFLI